MDFVYFVLLFLWDPNKNNLTRLKSSIVYIYLRPPCTGARERGGARLLRKPRPLVVNNAAPLAPPRSVRFIVVFFFLRSLLIEPKVRKGVQPLYLIDCVFILFYFLFRNGAAAAAAAGARHWAVCTGSQPVNLKLLDLVVCLCFVWG